MAETGSAIRERPAKSGESSGSFDTRVETSDEPSAKRPRSEISGSASRGDGGSGGTVPGMASVIEKTLTQALLMLAGRITVLEEGNKPKERGSGAAPDGMWVYGGEQVKVIQ